MELKMGEISHPSARPGVIILQRARSCTSMLLSESELIIIYCYWLAIFRRPPLTKQSQRGRQNTDFFPNKTIFQFNTMFI